MPEELYTSRDFCELAEKFEELKRENEELVSDKARLINAAMDGGDKYHYAAHDIAYKALEADYIISNRELLVKQVEIQRLTARVARLEGKLAELVEAGNKMRDLIEQDYDGWLDETIDWRGIAEEADDVLKDEWK